MTNAYQKAGVDVQAGYEVVDRIKKQIKKTDRLGVMSDIGGFGGLFNLAALAIKEPIMVSGTDGVGTKLMVAFEAEKHDTIGIDCVAMCVNDVVAQGAQPLYFLDYLAAGKTDPAKIEKIISGVVEGCRQSQMALIGGETAEMPGMYQSNHYDMAGFAVGVVEKADVIQGHEINENDVLIGISASGIHSNGFSLVRQIFFIENKMTTETIIPEFPSQTLGEVLLEPTKIYVDSLLPLFQKKLIHGAAHITGGGFVENIPRMLPAHLQAEITLGSWPILPIFKALAQYGNLKEMEMYEIFNMGIGMVLAVAPENVAAVLASLNTSTEQGFVIGQIIAKHDDQEIKWRG